MTQVLENLKIEDHQLRRLLKDQNMAFESLSRQRETTKAKLEEKIQTIEMHKKKIEERLDHFEDEFVNVEKQGVELLNILKGHQEKGKERLMKLDDAIRKFYTECQVVQERNNVLVRNLQSGFDKVIQGSARID